LIVLDTDAVSNLMRTHPSPGLIDMLTGVAVDLQGTTAITVGEIAYGAARIGRPELYRRALDLLSGFRILAFDRTAAEGYGRLRASLEARGQRLDDPDLRIAATALAHSAALVTGNRRHFERIEGLAVRSWIG
jgi:predicted nucleic acid-binding protein